MGTEAEIPVPESKLDGPPARPGRGSPALLQAAAGLLLVVLSWYLLKEFAVLLRPLVLAGFLCLVIYPIYLRLRSRVPGPVAVAVMVVGSVGAIYLLTVMIHVSVAELNEDLPRLIRRAEKFIDQGKAFLEERLPWVVGPPRDTSQGPGSEAAQLTEFTRDLVRATTDALLEALVVGVYLLFLLLEVNSFPRRVRAAFAPGRAEQILRIAGNVQAAITRYLHVKVQASLLLAVPVGLVLWACGVRFPLLWGVLTFLCNFIPYLGSVIAVCVPLLFALLQLDPGWQPLAAVLGVLGIHLVMTYAVEPRLVGRGVGMSPLVILVSLTFWGLCWGLVGMLLAVPLTVTLKILFENMRFTRPVARLLVD